MDTLAVFLADQAIYFFYLAVLGILVWAKNCRLFLLLTASASVSWIIGWLFKNFFYTPRPFLVSQTPPLIDFLMDGSFPSQHAILAFAAAFSVYYFYPRPGKALLVGSLFIATGRILVGVHTFADVAGGAVLAWLMVWIFCKFVITKIPVYHK